MFCSGKVLYAGQPIGLVVASTRKQALRAARLVQIKYKDQKKPVLTFKEAMQDQARVIVHEYFGPPHEHDVGNFDGTTDICAKIKILHFQNFYRGNISSQKNYRRGI